MNEYIALDASLLYYGIDLVIAIALLAGMRWLFGTVSNVSSLHELSEQNNAAFGIALAGALVAIAIMLTGVVSGDVGSSTGNEIVLMLAYGLLGILLMWVTRKMFDHKSLPDISVHEEIMKGNLAAGIIDAGNMIATAIIIRAVMVWVDSASLFGLFAVLGGYALSELLLLQATRYREKVYAMRHDDASMQKELADGNVALASRFSGYRIGVALAVTGASGIVNYTSDKAFILLILWGFAAVAMVLLLTAVSILMRKAILPNVDVAQEVGKERNVAIGAIQAAIYISVGFLISGLFG